MKLITPIFKKPYIELETEQEEELFKLDKDKEIERLNKDLKDACEEIKRLKEEYIMLQNASDEVEEEKDKEIERLTCESTKWESKFYDEAKKVDKAIEYIEKELGNINTNDNIIAKGICLKIKEIIGSDKE